jgi:hypothetical protein
MTCRYGYRYVTELDVAAGPLSTAGPNSRQARL